MADSGRHAKAPRLWKTLLIGACILVPIAGWVTLGERGLLRLYRTEMERQAYVQEIRRLVEENQRLLDEIKRLKDDRSYLEALARRELRLVKPGELVYRFRDQATEKTPSFPSTSPAKTPPP